MIKYAKLNITASDVTGQSTFRMRGVPTDRTVGELMDDLLPAMGLNRLDGNGAPVQFDLRLDREGRHLHRSEITGDTLQPDDHVVLHPRIMAGGLTK